MFPPSSKKLRSWGFVDALDPGSEPDLLELANKLSDFYRTEALKRGYWQGSDDANAVWTAEAHPYHVHLAKLISPGERVVDFGCGSAHPIANLPDGIEYVGIEQSAEQIEINRRRYPNHRFIQADMHTAQSLEESSDWAVSFFAIEHCVHPDQLLRRMVETCKPGGRIAVLCPNAQSGMNSLRSGFSGLTNRDKLKRAQLLDLAASYIEQRWVWPARIRAIHESSLTFPIYLRPRCFDAPWWSDTDAVYLATASKLARYFETLGCSIEVTSRDVEAAPESRDAVIYLVARKPARAAG
jgi:SAM-dependent methyltransferase